MVSQLHACSSPTLHLETLFSPSCFNLNVTPNPQLEPLVLFYIFPSLPLTRFYSVNVRVCVCHMHASFPVGRTLERDVPTEQSCKGQCIMAPTEIPPCNWTMVATLPNLTKFHVPLTIDFPKNWWLIWGYSCWLSLVQIISNILLTSILCFF